MKHYFLKFLFLLAIISIVSCQKEAPEPSKEKLDKGHDEPSRVEFIFTQGKILFDENQQPYFQEETSGIPTLNKQVIEFRDSENGIVNSGNTIRLQANADYRFEAIYYNTQGKRMNHEFTSSEMGKIHQHFFAIPKKEIQEGIPSITEIFDFFYADTDPEDKGFYHPNNSEVTLKKRTWDTSNPQAIDPIGLKGYFKVKQSDLTFNLRITLAHFLAVNKLNPQTEKPYDFYQTPSLNFFATDGKYLLPIRIYADLNEKETNPEKYGKDLSKVLTNIEKELALVKKDLEEIKKILLGKNNTDENHNHEEENQDEHTDTSSNVPSTSDEQPQETGERIELLFTSGHTHSPRGSKSIELHADPEYPGVKYFKSNQKIVFKKQGNQWVATQNKTILWEYADIEKRGYSALYGLQIVYYNSQNQRVNTQYMPDGKSAFQHFFEAENITAVKGSTAMQSTSELFEYQYKDTNPEQGKIKDRKGTQYRDKNDPVGLKGLFIIKSLYQKFDLKISLFHFDNKPNTPLPFNNKPNSGGHTDIVLRVPIFIFANRSDSNTYYQDYADAYGVTVEDIEADEEVKLESDINPEDPASGSYYL